MTSKYWPIKEDGWKLDADMFHFARPLILKLLEQYHIPEIPPVYLIMVRLEDRTPVVHLELEQPIAVATIEGAARGRARWLGLVLCTPGKTVAEDSYGLLRVIKREEQLVHPWPPEDLQALVAEWMLLR